jgi:hypothetical protein
MSSHDVIDPRFDRLVAELRAARPEAPPALRERVREIAARPPAPAPRPRRRVRLAWVLAPAAAAAVAGAATVAVLSSGDGAQPVAKQEKAARALAPQSTTTDQSALSAAPAPTRGRAQLYEAEMTLRVGDLSESAKRALRLTRSLGGHIRTIEYGTGPEAGVADVVVRVPVGRVQRAIAGFTELGTILSQHVSVRDIQPALDRRFARIQALRAEIASLAGDSSTEALARRERLQAEARALQPVQATERRLASFATVSLHLRTKDAAVAPPAPPGRIERALERAADVLVAELQALVYVLVVAAPFLVLGAGALLATRAHRRRADERLLA